MRFKITSAGNNSTFGDVFFSVPTKEEMQKAEKRVAEICHEKALKIYKDNPNVFENEIFARIEKEIEKMSATETVYHFLVLKEIAEVSREAGFPIMTEGNLSGSVISYLLGITEYDPMSFNLDYTPIELLWGSDETVITPDFSTAIAPQIRPLIHSRLDSKYGFVDCNKDIYKQLSLTDTTICERLGKLLKVTDTKPSFKDYNDKIYIQVIKNIADEYICEFEELKKEGYMFDEELPHVLSFAKDLKLMKHCNFKQLLSLYAYRQGSFNTKKSLSTLSNDFFTTRDEFFNALIYHKVPDAVAFEIVKKGVWSTQDKRKKYAEILSSYNTPECVSEYFSNVSHLWETHACISRLMLMCAIAWYQINYPTEFMTLENGEL